VTCIDADNGTLLGYLHLPDDQALAKLPTTSAQLLRVAISGNEAANKAQQKAVVAKQLTSRYLLGLPIDLDNVHNDWIVSRRNKNSSQCGINTSCTNRQRAVFRYQVAPIYAYTPHSLHRENPTVAGAYANPDNHMSAIKRAKFIKYCLSASAETFTRIRKQLTAFVLRSIAVVASGELPCSDKKAPAFTLENYRTIVKQFANRNHNTSTIQNDSGMLLLLWIIHDNTCIQRILRWLDKDTATKLYAKHQRLLQRYTITDWNLTVDLHLKIIDSLQIDFVDVLHNRAIKTKTTVHTDTPVRKT